MFAIGNKRKRNIDIQKHKSDLTPKLHEKSSHSQSPDKAPPRSDAIARHRHIPRNSDRSRQPGTQIARGRQTFNSGSSTPLTVDFGNDQSESDGDTVITIKRLKHQPRNFQLSRQISWPNAFKPPVSEEHGLVHAADIRTLDKSTKYVSAITDLAHPLELDLQYPSYMPPERYLLIKPIHDPQAFKAVTDITEVMHKVSGFYLPEKLRLRFVDESFGFPQRFQRAVNKKSVDDIIKVVEEYNKTLTGLLDDGTIHSVINQHCEIHPAVIERILNQTYSRTVSPNLSVLRRYQAGTDNVYGELLPKFVSCILTKELQLSPGDVFVDLGSGVGNVVLQAALEVGCESWGCEAMQEYCRVAVLQRIEFVARCHLWGLSLGEIRLEKGDFLENLAIKKALKRADAVLVNNQVFTPELNEALTNLFLDLKDGCRIVSLKSFVPSGHKITSRNLNSPYNVLSVERKEYYSSSVSWTSEGGLYYISTKDSKLIEIFLGS